MRSGEIFSKLSDKDTGYLIGLFLGDGYIYHDIKNRHYDVEFYLNSVKDREIQKYLIKILEKINLAPTVTKDKRYNCNKIRVRSKELFSYISSFRFTKNKNFNMGVISGLIDSDGYVSWKKSYIQIINTDKKLLEKIKSLLKNFDLDSTLAKRVKSKKDKLPSYALYISFKFIKTSNNSIKAKQ
ncbi:MAG: LAGLIDADG family homing endonuclease [Candidatus Aenigmatarchaeota archaeon]